jgi:hypothetical protein
MQCRIRKRVTLRYRDTEGVDCINIQSPKME